MKNFAIIFVILLLMFCSSACVPAPQQEFQTTSPESQLMTEQITDGQTTETETQQETQTQQEATEEETTYGPLHFPEETNE